MRIARITKPVGSTGRYSQGADVHRFVTEVNARRVFRDLAPEGERVCLTQLLRGANLSWHGVKLGEPDWGKSSHSIAFTVEIRREKMLFHSIFNAYWEALDFELPQVDKISDKPWKRWIDTALDSPHDIVQWETAESVPGYAYRTQARSVVVLFAGTNESNYRRKFGRRTKDTNT
jgi:isoamylase